MRRAEKEASVSTRKNRNRSVVVIGLGSFGSTVAMELARFGNRVLGIDVDELRVARHADHLAEAIIADGRDEQTLRDAGVANYDIVVVAIGENLEASIVCTMNARLLGVKTVWVKALNRTHHRILAKLGADRVIQPEQEIGQHIAQMLHNPMVRDYVSLGNGFHVVNILTPERLEGKRIGALDLAGRFDLRCLGLMRGTEYIDCAVSDPELKAEDRMLLLGRRPALRAFSEEI
ncbi:MAG: TrkA family potassium uptake protein [Rhodobacteraceae bacterium]|nr:MAG: TrkA family potassium uptake protein [Paracoccaceae bacterium]